MFSSVAHLARANPFNAPHLQLVHDGPSGPRSPQGPTRRSRHLAAAAVEGEVTPYPGPVVIPLLCLPGPGWKSG
ncbi:Phosphate carrier protein, mitochondrial [Microtus ochrogaster]|uniref:Phosphate carrier protein, mitochondrial n=1 Tax=Microtus ochrogaster TaxID=79684 RepID=A0A8J6FVL6_MICOH|nr:Phosphate carrier protein, mitochondrial [Microtus ochrogaster]